MGSEVDFKRKLHELLYYICCRRYPGVSPMVNYIRARNQANYCLEAIGEKLDEE